MSHRDLDEERGWLFFVLGCVITSKDDRLSDEMWLRVPFVVALTRLGQEHPERLRELWHVAMQEPMPFGQPPIGLPKVKPP